MIRTLWVTGALLCLGGPAWGQGPPGTNLTVDVAVQRIQLRGDTVAMQYSVRNSPRSAEDLWSFTVEAPSPPLHVSLPQPAEDWMTAVLMQGLPVARWVTLGNHVRRGAGTPDLSFAAVGLPGMVDYWAGGYFPVPDYEPVDEDTLRAVTPRQALAANAVVGQTVGVEPFPTDLSPGNLLARLRVLTDSACSLGWIQGRGTCHELDEHLDQAGRELQRGRREDAREHLREFLGDLRVRAGRRSEDDVEGHGWREDRDERQTAVNSSAYWLLVVNAEYLLRHLCEPGERCQEDH